MDFVITSQQILWICGFIASIWGVVKIFKELKKKQQIKTLFNRVDSLEDRNNMNIKDTNKKL